MLKHLLVAALAVSSLAMAGNNYHPAVAAPPPPMMQRAPLPPPPPPVVFRQGNDDRFDGVRGNQLLRDFDAAAARRDFRALSAIDHRFSDLLRDELGEAGRGRSERVKRNQLSAIASQLEWLQGRMDRRALNARRTLYVELVELAQQRDHGRRF